MRHAKGRGAEIVDGQENYSGYRNSPHERSARKMANYARLGVDEMQKAAIVEHPSPSAPAHPFLGVVLPGGHVSDYHAPAGRTDAPSHSLHYQDAGLTGFDNDHSLRFVKNLSRGSLRTRRSSRPAPRREGQFRPDQSFGKASA